MDPQTKITLIFNRKDFEEIYSQNIEYNYFKSSLTKKTFQSLIISSLLLIGFFYHSFTQNSIQIQVIFIGAIFLYNQINFFTKALTIRKRRKEVSKYLNEIEKIKSHQLILTNETFQIIQESEKTIEKWVDFKLTEINDTYVFLLTNKEHYLIPKKSMTESEFGYLKTFLSKKVNIVHH